VQTPGIAPLLVDPDLIVLALRQLIDNALKYSGPGTPVICRAQSIDGRVRISVIDRGAGIPERDRERIFEKFYRRASVRNSLPGTGLGLHIAREIVRIHGGDLWMEPSRNGSPQGSEFSMSLPFAEEIAE
jgi:two-component system sensor histidine kinase SenX3